MVCFEVVASKTTCVKCTGIAWKRMLEGPVISHDGWGCRGKAGNIISQRREVREGCFDGTNLVGAGCARRGMRGVRSGVRVMSHFQRWGLFPPVGDPGLARWAVLGAPFQSCPARRDKRRWALYGVGVSVRQWGYAISATEARRDARALAPKSIHQRCLDILIATPWGVGILTGRGRRAIKKE